MKIYFHFNTPHHAALYHEMAKFLQPQKENYEFAGFLVNKSSQDLHLNFLKNQNEVDYKYIDISNEIDKTAFNSEIDINKIKKWEKRLNCPLWHLVLADRNLGHHFINGGIIPKTKLKEKSNQKIAARFVCYYLDFFEARFKKFQPDAVFFIALASLPSLTMVKVAEYMEIPFFILRSYRILNQQSITVNSIFEQSQEIKQDLKKWQSNPELKPKTLSETKQYLESFNTDKPSLPSWAKNKKEQDIFKNNWFRFLIRVVTRLSLTKYKQIKQRNKEKSLISKDPFYRCWLDTRRKPVFKLHDKFYFQKFQPEKESYIYFPLHVEPEASTMVLSPNFSNQLVVIEHLAKNMPLSHKLYVKEHPSMKGKRPLGFYKKITKFPNVKLISPEENSFSLIEKADLVTVITGTAGWEAIMMKKPVLTFGDCFYTNLGFSKKCTDINNLGNKIKNLIFNPPHIEEKDLETLLAAIFENSFSVDNSVIWQKKKLGNLKPEEKEIAHKIAKNLDQSIKKYYANA